MFTLLPRQVGLNTSLQDLKTIQSQWFCEAWNACHIRTIEKVTRLLGQLRPFPVARVGIFRAYEVASHCRVVAIIEDRNEGWSDARQSWNLAAVTTVWLCPPDHKFFRGDVVAQWKQYAHKDQPEAGGLYIPGDWILPFLQDVPRAAEVENREFLTRTEAERQELHERLTAVLNWE